MANIPALSTEAEPIPFMGYFIIPRVGAPRGTYYLWWNGKKGKEEHRLGFFDTIELAKESIRIIIETGKRLTGPDLVKMHQAASV